ncbi:MAG: phytanoyl-CoA dioxygenase family protein, partial [Candidatus Latescibacterota bacterium]|nr:phytanoyl-CoA dioxygenase family protein [Candidatus Latescibacterota bacterium]
MYITTSSPIQAGQPYTAEESERIVDQFNRDGYCHLGAVLSDDEVGALLEAMQRKVKDPRMAEDHPGDHRRGVQNLMRMFEYDITFRDLIVREPFASLAEAILGETCQCMAQNAL